MSKFISEKIYKIVGAGADKKYPRINLPTELAEDIGKIFWIEKDKNTGVITLRPVERKN